jgi:hypothetical protein
MASNNPSTSHKPKTKPANLPPEEQWEDVDLPVELDQKWDTMEEAKKAVKAFILDRGESWAPIQDSSKGRMILECKDKRNCDFYIRLAELKKQGHCAVTTYRPHVCPPRTHANFSSRNASWYIGNKIERDIMKNRKITVKDLRERADLYHAIPNLPYMATWRAAEKVRADIDGDEGASFQLIPDYLRRLQEADPDTYTRCKINKHTGRFEAAFFALGPARKAFASLRGLVGLDGTHTRSKYGMTLLTAVMLDADNHVVPIAWALVPIENEDWWHWFCAHIKRAFQIDTEERSWWPVTLSSFSLTFISDRDKGLSNSVERVFPDAAYSYCCQHISENIYKRYGKECRNLFWPIARARTLKAITLAATNLKKLNPKAEEYLAKIGYQNFSYYSFPRSRFGHDTNNLTESVNSIWGDLRNLPPLRMLDGIVR